MLQRGFEADDSVVDTALLDSALDLLEAAEEVASLAAECGVQAVAFQADVADDSACRGMVEEAEKQMKQNKG